MKPGDVDVAQLYDGFTVLSLYWLEGMQFCGKGESGAFVEGGERISLTGELPLATSGGQLSGRPAPQLRPSLRGVPPVAWGRRAAPGAGRQGGGGIGGRGTVGVVPTAQNLTIHELTHE